MSVELTFKRESKELETALEVVRNLINVSRNQIKSEPENGIFQEELYQLQAVEDIIEYADFYYEDWGKLWVWQWKNTWKWWIELGKARMPSLVKLELLKLMEVLMVKVRNMKSSNGNSVANQFEIETDDATYLQSYNSIIAKRMDSGVTYLDEYYWDYSVTTGRYRNMFLGENKGVTQMKIDSGEYILTNLNN